MKIENGIYKSVSIRWEAVTLPLKAGTPITKAGVPCNDGSAVGLIPQTITVKPTLGDANILIGGDVSLAEVEASYGSSLDGACIRAMDGIRFYSSDGTPVAMTVPYTLPAATSSVLGGVKVGTGLSVATGGTVSVAGATASVIGGVKQGVAVAKAAGEAPTKAEFDALIDALTDAGVLAETEDE